MQEMIIVFGAMGSGKTVYAKRLVKELGYEYLYFDNIFSKMFGGKFEPFLNYITTKIDKEKINVVLDGWFVWDENQIRSVKKVEEKATVRWIHLFAPKWMLADRIKNKESDVRGPLDLSIERTLPNRVKCKIIDASDFEYEECSRQEYERRMQRVTESETKALLDGIKEYEPYQNIQLPGGHSTNGYTDCEKSWRQIYPLIGWEGKTVLDVGCYWGYFCFQIKSEGAKAVVGTDVSRDAVRTARKIRSIKRINAVFKEHDIESDEIDREYDIILLLNTLHHLRSPFHTLRKIFNKAKAVILEIELPHDKSLGNRPTAEMGEPIKLSGGKMGGHLRFSREMLMRFASENGHFLKKETESMRPNRTILLFGREA